MKERLPINERHDSMRGHFAYELHYHMQKKDNIFVITADLGYGMFDRIRGDFPDRFINVGAAEQAAVGVAVGMAYRDKIPVVYSITPFLLARPYEWIRNYLDHEQSPVKLVGGGRDRDYSHDGFTHHAEDARDILCNFPGIVKFFPETKEEIVDIMGEFLYNEKPSFLSLRR